MCVCVCVCVRGEEMDFDRRTAACGDEGKKGDLLGGLLKRSRMAYIYMFVVFS